MFIFDCCVIDCFSEFILDISLLEFLFVSHSIVSYITQKLINAIFNSFHVANVFDTLRNLRRNSLFFTQIMEEKEKQRNGSKNIHITMDYHIQNGILKTSR